METNWLIRQMAWQMPYHLEHHGLFLSRFLSLSLYVVWVCVATVCRYLEYNGVASVCVYDHLTVWHSVCLYDHLEYHALWCVCASLVTSIITWFMCLCCVFVCVSNCVCCIFLCMNLGRLYIHFFFLLRACLFLTTSSIIVFECVCITILLWMSESLRECIEIWLFVFRVSPLFFVVPSCVCACGEVCLTTSSFIFVCVSYLLQLW